VFLQYFVPKTSTSQLIVSCRTKQVRMVHERLKIIAEVEKNPTEEWFDMAKYLGLSPSTLNSTVGKKVEIVEQISKCRKSCKKKKAGGNSVSCKLQIVWLVCYKTLWASGICIDGQDDS